MEFFLTAILMSFLVIKSKLKMSVKNQFWRKFEDGWFVLKQTIFINQPFISIYYQKIKLKYWENVISIPTK